MKRAAVGNGRQWSDALVEANEVEGDDDNESRELCNEISVPDLRFPSGGDGAVDPGGCK